MIPGRLVLCGCSYMANYANGSGHIDFAKQLNIPYATSLADFGISNNNILRRVLKDSYASTIPTFYLIGLSFFDRTELPVLTGNNDETWLSFPSQTRNFSASDSLVNTITAADVYQFDNLRDRIWAQNGKWQFDDFILRLTSFINDLEYRGHAVLVFSTADYINGLVTHTVKQLLVRPEIVDALTWQAVQWQHKQGANAFYEPGVPAELRHIKPGQHQYLNKFLLTYMKQYPVIYNWIL